MKVWYTLLAAALLLAFTPAAPRPLAPGFRLATLAGGTSTLQQHRGKVVLVNFWATWCPPCRTEIPVLMKLQANYGRDQVVVLGVAMDEEGEKAVGPFVQHGRFQLNGAPARLNYPVLIGNGNVADAYRVDSLPMTVLIDRDGREVRRIDGVVEFEDVARSIRSLLHETSGK